MFIMQDLLFSLMRIKTVTEEDFFKKSELLWANCCCPGSPPVSPSSVPADPSAMLLQCLAG